MDRGLKNRIESYFDRLWPICRSITGPGFNESLDILSEIMPMTRLKFNTGEKVFDWVVPREWTARDAYFIDPKGKKHADFKVSNLHLLGYSIPFKGRMTLAELQPHLYSLPNQPEAIPYLTSYYKDRWGFCLKHQDLLKLSEGEYEVVIDTELKAGHLHVGEAILPGESKEEILFSSYLCHPSMANNELTGPLVLAFLYEKLAQLKKRRYTCRFVICPETIGTIAYLSRCGDHLKKKLKAGYVLTCLGIRNSFMYKRSRDGTSLADRVAQVVLRDFGSERVISFNPADGSDDRQYGSPGFNLPVGSLMSTSYGEYPEYHTSLDNKALIDFDFMAESVSLCEALVQALDANYVWQGKVLYGEPFLSQYNLYPTLGSQKISDDKVQAMMWLINFADGQNDLITIAEKSKISLAVLIPLAEELQAVGLLHKK